MRILPKGRQKTRSHGAVKKSQASGKLRDLQRDLCPRGCAGPTSFVDVGFLETTAGLLSALGFKQGSDLNYCWGCGYVWTSYRDEYGIRRRRELGRFDQVRFVPARRFTKVTVSPRPPSA
jgi:hypothetical protein